MTKAPVRVVYLTHTLGVGGAEEVILQKGTRLATRRVWLAGAEELILTRVTRLPRDRYEPIVCCFENPPGPIGPEIAAHGISVIPLGVVPGWRSPFARGAVARQRAG